MQSRNNELNILFAVDYQVNGHVTGCPICHSLMAQSRICQIIEYGSLLNMAQLNCLVVDGLFTGDLLERCGTCMW